MQAAPAWYPCPCVNHSRRRTCLCLSSDRRGSLEALEKQKTEDVLAPTPVARLFIWNLLVFISPPAPPPRALPACWETVSYSTFFPGCRPAAWVCSAGWIAGSPLWLAGYDQECSWWASDVCSSRLSLAAEWRHRLCGLNSPCAGFSVTVLLI